MLVAATAIQGCTQLSPAALPTGVSASIYQQRMDYGPRALQLTVANASDTAITVSRAAFRSPRFYGSTEWTRRVRIDAGTTVNLRILLGAPVCSGDEAGIIDLDYALDDGSTGTATLDPTDQFGTLSKVTAQDCIGEEVGGVARFEIADQITTEWHGDQLVALVALTGTPTGGPGTVVVTEVARTILVRPEDGGTAWALGWTLDAHTGPITATLPLQPSNCNPHIVAEDKRGTYFPLEVVGTSGTGGTVYVGVRDEARRAIYAYIADYCGW